MVLTFFFFLMLCNMKREFSHWTARYCAKMIWHIECARRIIWCSLVTHLKILLYNMEKKKKKPQLCGFMCIDMPFNCKTSRYNVDRISNTPSEWVLILGFFFVPCPFLGKSMNVIHNLCRKHTKMLELWFQQISNRKQVRNKLCSNISDFKNRLRYHIFFAWWGRGISVALKGFFDCWNHTIHYMSERRRQPKVKSCSQWDDGGALLTVVCWKQTNKTQRVVASSSGNGHWV